MIIEVINKQGKARTIKSGLEPDVVNCISNVLKEEGVVMLLPSSMDDKKRVELAYRVSKLIGNWNRNEGS